MPRSFQYPILGLILPVSRNPKTQSQTLTLENVNICPQTSIEPDQYVANMITNAYIPLKHVYNARIVIIGF